MSERNVAELYDALLAFESRHKEPGAYPVHKRLRFDDSSTRDIYDWIEARVDVRGAGNVLDAGCGVGFGTLMLAERGAASVTGISLSALELARARRAAAERGLADRATFRLQSFDELPESAYGLVIAVESLKHSPDIALSLRSIVRALVVGGTLVVVEDLAATDANDADARGLAEDWGLARLYGENDYLALLKPEHREIVDLTGCVQRARSFELLAKLAALDAAVALGPAARARVIRAFRGGLRLEKLYARRAMSYKAIFYTRAEGTTG